MKKPLLLFTLLFTCAIARAQSSSAGAFKNGDNLINLGIGVGSPFFSSGYTSSLPVNPTVSYEHGITDEISIGGQLSYASAKYDYTLVGSGYSFKENAVYVGGRGSYHLNDILNLGSKFDIYGGGSLGYVIVNVSDNEGYSGSAASALGFGAFAGGKYFFSSSAGVYAELGYQSLSFLNVGINFKF